MRLATFMACVLCACASFGGFGSAEEVVDCNGGDGWTAETISARPGSASYYICIVDQNSVRVKVGPNGRPKLDGSFEWRGREVQRVMVRVEKNNVPDPAYSKIFALVKAKEECSLTVDCEDQPPGQAMLVGAEFTKRGKTFEAQKDGKVREVQSRD